MSFIAEWFRKLSFVVVEWVRKRRGAAPAGSAPTEGVDMSVQSPVQSIERAVANQASVPFAKRLNWRIQEGFSVEQVTITPAMASEMLEWNDRNRPLNKTVVKRYAASMKAGRWAFTSQPVTFCPKGLIDGQHRLAACVESGVAFESLVVFGAREESFAFIDVGARRTAGDIFSINGVANASLMSAATALIYGYDNNIMRSASTKGVSLGLDHAALFDLYQTHERLQDSVWVGHLFHRNRLASPSMMTALHYICARESRSDADEFFRKVADGVGITGAKDPAHKLRNRLIANATSQAKAGRPQIAGITVKAWNAARLGRPVGTLRFNADETFPRAI